VIRRVDHIGILVRNLEEGLHLYTQVLGLQGGPPTELPDQQVRLAFVGARGDQIELVEPASPESPLGRVMAKRGEGLFHLCLDVDDIQAALRRLKAAGVQWVDREPWRSPCGLVAFVHPKSCGSVSIELLQRLGGPQADGAATSLSCSRPVSRGVRP
jgi:methylmalonyl-CoA epimerase